MIGQGMKLGSCIRAQCQGQPDFANPQHLISKHHTNISRQQKDAGY